MRYDPTSTPIDEAEIAAALAAVRCYIEQDQPPAARELPARAPWRAAAALEASGLPPARSRAFCTWGAAERAARASRWSHGIVGL